MICYVSQDDIKYLLRLLKTELSSLTPNLDKAKICGFGQSVGCRYALLRYVSIVGWQSPLLCVICPC